MAKLVRGILREDRMMTVVGALEQAGVTGMTVMGASGRGKHSPYGVYRGIRYRALVPVCVVDVITDESRASDVARLMMEHGRTGEHGDGHVLIINVDECYAVRTRWLEVA